MKGASTRARTLLLVFLSFCIPVLCAHLVHVDAGDFPIGLSVEYDVSCNTFTGTEKFEVLSWATGSPDDSILVSLMKTSGGGTTTETMTLSLATWDSLLGIPPILVDISTWHTGQATTIPSRSRTYNLSTTMTRVSEGTYASWTASYWAADLFSFDSESMNYEQALGVLLSWYDHYLSIPYYSVEYSAVLQHSNMAQFGRPTQEAVAIVIVLSAAFLAVLCIAVVAIQRRLRQGSSSRASPLLEESAESIVATDQPQVEQSRLHEEAPPPPSFAGAEGQGCVVCGYELRPGEPVLTCPHCGARGHRSHFLEWAKIKRSCPQCHETLEATDFEKRRSSGRSARGSRQPVLPS